jgi:hypothetical protein
VDALMTVVAVVAALNREAPCREEAEQTPSVGLQCEAVLPDAHRDDPSRNVPVADAWRLAAVTGGVLLTKFIVAGNEPWKHPRVPGAGYPWG